MAMVNGRSLVAIVIALMVLSFQGCGAIGLCGISTDDLAECKPAVTGPNPVNPSSECCGILAKADLPCLCGYKNSATLPLLGIDPGLAMGLPAKCGLPTPPDCQ